MTPVDPKQLPVDFFCVTTNWAEKHSGSHVGVLAIASAVNPASSQELDGMKRDLERELRRIHSGKDRIGLRADPVLHAYDEYYRRFDKTYHVQLQLESILFKGKSIPSGAALVEAMFMAEIESRLLTAGHDLAAIAGSLKLDVATGGESYTLLRGTQQAPKPDDMMISDEIGIISSIVYGPDQRTQIRAATHAAVFTAYAPAGIRQPAIEEHLDRIRMYARTIAPALQTLLLQVYPAD